MNDDGVEKDSFKKIRSMANDLVSLLNHLHVSFNVLSIFYTTVVGHGGLVVSISLVPLR